MLNLTIPLDPTLKFLVGLLNTPSPTGYHVEAIEYVRKAFEALNIPDLTLSLTGKGALMMVWKGEQNDAPRGITAHIDTLGLMVKEIKSNGRLKTTQLGGYAWSAVNFEGVTIRTHDNKRYRGTVVPVNPSVHVNANLRTTIHDQDNMEIRIDAKTSNADDTKALGISVGDFVFLDPRVEVTDTGFIRSRHLDDKLSVACIYGALVAMRDAGVKPAQETHILISNYEEVGHGGSSGWAKPLSELVAIDMAAMGDGQTSDEYSCTICVKDSTGPYHFEMNNKLRAIAAAHSIPVKIDIYPFYGSDGSAYWRAGGDAIVGLIGPGVESSHAYERTHTDSIQHSAALIGYYLSEK